MANKNGKGPEEKGSRTGRGMGNCRSTSENTSETEYGKMNGNGRKMRGQKRRNRD